MAKRGAVMQGDKPRVGQGRESHKLRYGLAGGGGEGNARVGRRKGQSTKSRVFVKREISEVGVKGEKREVGGP